MASSGSSRVLLEGSAHFVREPVGPLAALAELRADFGGDCEPRRGGNAEGRDLVQARRFRSEKSQADVRVQLCVKRIQKGHGFATLSQAGGSAQCR